MCSTVLGGWANFLNVDPLFDKNVKINIKDPQIARISFRLNDCFQYQFRDYLMTSKCKFVIHT